MTGINVVAAKQVISTKLPQKVPYIHLRHSSTMRSTSHFSFNGISQAQRFKPQFMFMKRVFDTPLFGKRTIDNIFKLIPIRFYIFLKYTIWVHFRDKEVKPFIPLKIRFRVVIVQIIFTFLYQSVQFEKLLVRNQRRQKSCRNRFKLTSDHLDFCKLLLIDRNNFSAYMRNQFNMTLLGQTQQCFPDRHWTYVIFFCEITDNKTLPFMKNFFKDIPFQLIINIITLCLKSHISFLTYYSLLLYQIKYNFSIRLVAHGTPGLA